MRGKLLVVSDWLINGSLKFYSRIAPPPFAKGGGANVEKIRRTLRADKRTTDTARKNPD